MACDDVPMLTDDELDRRARELFAEVRAEQSEAMAERALETAAIAAGEVVPVLPDWLWDDHGIDSEPRR